MGPDLIIFIGAVCCLISSIGISRLKGLLLELHAASVASSLGLPLLLLGAAWSLGTETALGKAAGVILVMYSTSPVVGHLMGLIGLQREAKRTNQ